MPHAARLTPWPLLLLLLVVAPAAAAPAPTPEVALSIAPLHPVDYTQPSPAEAKQCKVDKEQAGKVSSWVVRSGDGQILRRFSDTNADVQVDVWCYYKDGLEVYRDLDTNFDRKADQHRWFNTGGARWGIDEDQDETIDRWQRISPYEVGEQLVNAIRDKDESAFKSLLLSSSELNDLRLDPTMRDQFASRLDEAPAKFRALVQRQKVLTDKSRFVDFGVSRPGALPTALGSDGPEVVVYEGASALVDTDGKSDQVQVGVLVQVGDAWRLAEAPQLGSDNVELSSVFAFSRFSSAASGQAGTAAPPTEEMEPLMAELQKLDSRMATLPGPERAKLIPQREKVLLELAKVTSDAGIREQWYSQIADMYSSALMEGHYKEGEERLANLEKALSKAKVSSDLMSHVRYQRLLGDWVLKNQDPKQDIAKAQEDWLKQLRAFVKAYPDTPDAAEACSQLGMTLEIAGETEEAAEWYGRLAEDYAGTPRGEKGKGALRRLDSMGKPLALAGPSLRGGSIDLAKYRGKHVLLLYWATWYESSKTDMAVINQAYSKYGPKGFEVLGVNLDNSVGAAKAFLAENRYPWENLYDSDGLEGRLANEMGVMTLPLMILVDDKGRVVNRNVQAPELEAELKRLLK